MSGERTDLAALLIAVFAVGLGPLDTPGNWNSINTFVCVPVLVVLWVYSLHRERRSSPLTAERLAVALVFGFIFSIGLSWPCQALLTHPTDPAEAYHLALIPAFLVVLVLWLLWPGPRQETKPDEGTSYVKLPGSAAPKGHLDSLDTNRVQQQGVATASLADGPPGEPVPNPWIAISRVNAVLATMAEIGRPASTSEIHDKLKKAGRPENAEQIRNTLGYLYRRTKRIIRVDQGLWELPASAEAAAVQSAASGNGLVPRTDA
jgi:hypothetical protein